jgi:hypothetical protein
MNEVPCGRAPEVPPHTLQGDKATPEGSVRSWPLTHSPELLNRCNQRWNGATSAGTKKLVDKPAMFHRSRPLETIWAGAGSTLTAVQLSETGAGSAQGLEKLKHRPLSYPYDIVTWQVRRPRDGEAGREQAPA